MALDQKHLATIQRVLAAIASVEPDPVRAMIALEDAYVALAAGFAFHLTTDQIQEQSALAASEGVAEDASCRTSH